MTIPHIILSHRVTTASIAKKKDTFTSTASITSVIIVECSRQDIDFLIAGIDESDGFIIARGYCYELSYSFIFLHDDNSRTTALRSLASIMFHHRFTLPCAANFFVSSIFTRHSRRLLAHSIAIYEHYINHSYNPCISLVSYSKAYLEYSSRHKRRC
jgi:hypothetical protein